jgi:O-antigen ligase
LISYNEVGTGKILKTILYLKNFFLLIVMVHILQNKKYSILFFKVILICCLFVALDNILQFYSGKDLFGYSKSQFRLTGPFGPGEYVSGAYLSKFSVLVLPVLFYRNKKDTLDNENSYLLSFYGLIIFFLFSIIITGDRASSLIFLIGVFTFFIIYFKNYKKIIFLLGIVSAFMVLLLLTSNVIQHKLFHTSYQIGVLKYFDKRVNIPNQFADYKDRSFYDSKHGAHFLTAIEIWKDNPIIGVGPKNFSTVCKKIEYDKINSLNKDKRCNTHPHNQYLELLSEVGILGFASFLLIILLLLKKTIMIMKKNKDNFLISSFSQNMGLLWPIISTGSLFSNFNGSFIWINLGLCFALYETNK